MENASKALIIAGAVLISILLISLGIMIYNQAKQVTDNTNLDEISITTYNEKFNQYLGEKVKASVVNSLMGAVNQNNTTTSSGTAGNKITLQPDTNSGISETATGSKIYKGVASSAYTYKVTITGYSATGQISEITIASTAR